MKYQSKGRRRRKALLFQLSRGVAGSVCRMGHVGWSVCCLGPSADVLLRK